MTLEIQKRETFISLQEYIKKFIPGVKEMIEWFQQGEEHKALENMVHVVEGLEWISQAVLLTKELHSDFVEIEKINPLLNEINKGLEQNDTILIADILEYEIIPIIEEWNNKINKQ